MVRRRFVRGIVIGLLSLVPTVRAAGQSQPSPPPADAQGKIVLIQGHVDSALLLIAHGADVRAADAGGHTPLHIAALGGQIAAAEALMRGGAYPAATTRAGLSAARNAYARYVAVVLCRRPYSCPRTEVRIGAPLQQAQPRLA